MEHAPPPTSSVDITFVADIVMSYISHNSVGTTELPKLIFAVHDTLIALSAPLATVDEAAKRPTPAQVRKSIKPDGLISFEDGKSYKTLRRHLTAFGLTPTSYREKWGLSSDYPMTAPSYSAQRSILAKHTGLGRRRSELQTIGGQMGHPFSQIATPKRRGRPLKKVMAPDPGLDL